MRVHDLSTTAIHLHLVFIIMSILLTKGHVPFERNDPNMTFPTKGHVRTKRITDGHSGARNPLQSISSSVTLLSLDRF